MGDLSGMSAAWAELGPWCAWYHGVYVTKQHSRCPWRRTSEDETDKWFLWQDL